MNEQNAINKLTLDPRKLTHLSKEEMYMMLSTSMWKQLNQASRLALLQELENRQARLDNRPAVRICAGKMDKRLMGQHIVTQDGQETIILNEKFIKDSKLFAGKEEQVFNVAAAVNTVLHEGRHSYQYHAVEGGQSGLSQEQILEWAATMPEFGGVYFNGSGNLLAAILYSMQGIEQDARRFARRRIREMNAFYRENGIRDLNYMNEETGDRNYERMLIQYVRRFLTMEKLDMIEKSIVDHFRKLHPEIDVSKLTLFDSARLILSHPEISDLDKMLDMIDESADRKLRLRDGENMKISNQVDCHTTWGGIAAKKKFP